MGGLVPQLPPVGESSLGITGSCILNWLLCPLRKFHCALSRTATSDLLPLLWGGGCVPTP